MKKELIPLESGQKIIFSNGVTGRISAVDAEDERILVSLDKPHSELARRAGFSGLIDCPYGGEFIKDFYLLGENLIGNKDSETSVDTEIEVKREKIKGLMESLERERLELDCLRKRRFQLTHNMTGEKRKSPQTPLKSSTSDESNLEGKL